MLGMKKVLVGVDGVPADENPDVLVLPPPTREAVNLAVRLAEASGAELTFFLVTEACCEEEQAIVEAEAKKLLAALADEAARRGVTVQTQVATGRPWMEIIKEVLRDGHQMVMVGSRQHSRARRMVLGSTGTKLLRKCPCPVWVVRPEEAAEVRTVVVADDLTKVGERCLDLGVSAARYLDARLLVLHAIELPLERPLRRSGAAPQELDDYRDKIRTDAEQAINERLAMTDFRTIGQGTRIEVKTGRPDLVIEHAIEEHSAGLLVMGTIARGGVPGLLLGNTAERLVPVVNCSVIAVKPDDFVSPIQPD